jgi:4-amino-4-deoxy-L-arabinose transferase-like glycosyltransferase
VSGAARERFLWVGLAVAAFLPRALGALLRPPWHDEYFTAWASGLSWAKLIAALRLDSGPPLPYALAKVVALTGIAPLASARLVAVLAGTAAVLLAAGAARRRFGGEAGWWAGGILAFHPLAVAWSAEGRAYALLLLATALAWERVERLIRDGRGAAGVGLAVALACWSHSLGVLLAAVLAVVALTLEASVRRRVLLAVGGGFATYLPWLPVAAHQPTAAVAWMATFWRTLPPLEKLVAPLRLLSPVGRFALTLDLPSPPWWVEACGAAIVLVLAVSGIRAERRPRPTTAAFLLPVAALALGAAFGVPVLYPGRGEALYLVPFVVLLGVGAVRSRALRTAAVAAIVAAIAVTTTTIVGWARRAPSPEQRLAAALRQRLPEGGEVVVSGYWRLGIAYHLGGARPRFVLVNYPASAAAHPGWYDPAFDRPAPGELDRLVAVLRRRASGTAIVVTPGLEGSQDLERLAATLGLRPVLRVEGGEIWLAPKGSAG